MSDEIETTEEQDVEAHRKLSEEPGTRAKKFGDDADDVEAHTFTKPAEKKFDATEKKY